MKYSNNKILPSLQEVIIYTYSFISRTRCDSGSRSSARPEARLTRSSQWNFQTGMWSGNVAGPAAGVLRDAEHQCGSSPCQPRWKKRSPVRSFLPWYNVHSNLYGRVVILCTAATSALKVANITQINNTILLLTSWMLCQHSTTKLCRHSMKALSIWLLD